MHSPRPEQVTPTQGLGSYSSVQPVAQRVIENKMARTNGHFVSDRNFISSSYPLYKESIATSDTVFCSLVPLMSTLE